MALVARIALLAVVTLLVHRGDASDESVCGPVLASLWEMPFGDERSLLHFTSKKDEPFELRVRRTLTGYRFNVLPAGDNPKPVGFALVEERPKERQLFIQEVRILEDQQGHGLATTLLNYLRESSPADTTLRFKSTNIETNVRLSEIDSALFGAAKPVGKTVAEQYANRSARITEEVRRLMREGPKESVPLWVRSLQSAGWKDIEVEVQSSGDIYIQGKH